MSDKLFIAHFLNIHRSGVLTALAWLVPHETAAISAQVLCTPYNHASCHLMQSHIRKVYASLGVTCHLHLWQKDRDLLHATAVTRGWNRYQNKSQHRKSTLEKKILPPLLQGFETGTFQSRIRRSNHWAIPVPRCRGPQSWPAENEVVSRAQKWFFITYHFFYCICILLVLQCYVELSRFQGFIELFAPGG